MSCEWSRDSAAARTLGLLLLLQIHHVGVDEVIGSVVQSQDAAYCFLKSGCHVGSIFSASLKVGTAAVVAAPPLRVLRRHLPVGHVHLVTQHHEREVVRVFDVSVICELLLPVSQVAKALPVVQAEGEQAAVGAAVERRAEAAEALLTRRVPDLQRDLLAVHLQLLVEELHADGVEEVGVEFVGDVSVHERGLAHAAVAQKDDLHEGGLGHRACVNEVGPHSVPRRSFGAVVSPERHKKVSLALALAFNHLKPLLLLVSVVGVFEESSSGLHQVFIKTQTYSTDDLNVLKQVLRKIQKGSSSWRAEQSELAWCWDKKSPPSALTQTCCNDSVFVSSD